MLGGTAEWPKRAKGHVEAQCTGLVRMLESGAFALGIWSYT